MDIYSKFDLHIHSKASAKTKTGDIPYVAESTIEKLSALINKLEENEVNMVAITDHNIFDKDLYLELKKQEYSNKMIHKVLPGTEIDLDIEGKIVHVVCVFDDMVPDYIDRISESFEQKDAYTIDELGAFLRKIGLGVVLIAHQKCDYTMPIERQKRTSLSCAGKDQFYKFIGCEFFDALEVQNTKVEGILRSRFSADNILNVSLVVGSDCHEWESYPAHHNGQVPTELMYMKALPTFQGLVMSITDTSRLYRYVEPPRENAIKELLIEINGQKKNISLSDRINVIIGDNSVGKSTLIKYLSGVAEKGAIHFLDSHNVKILTEKLSEDSFVFSGQGKIREMFESSEEKLPIKEKFKEFFKPIDKKRYEKDIQRILSYYKSVWERNDLVNKNMQILSRNLQIPVFTEKDKHYVSIENNILKSENRHRELVHVFEQLYNEFTEFNNYKRDIDTDDINALREIRKSIIAIGKKYYEICKKNEIDLEIQSSFEFAAKEYIDMIGKQSSADEARLNTFRTEYQHAIESICMDIDYRFSPLNNAWNNFKDFKIEESVNQKGKYCFVDKAINSELINKDFIIKYIADFLDTDKPLEKLSSTEVLNSIRTKKIKEQTAENVNKLLNIIYYQFSEEYMSTTVEIKQGKESIKESNSAGINALYYIDILSETYSKPIFIIDQPEDDVSQSRISTHLIPSLKTLSNKAQVFIVTHNPQLVVNLDADNVIAIKKEDNVIGFYSGPLEFSDATYSILGLVAKTLDGGADVIRKRWKRYDKTIV